MNVSGGRKLLVTGGAGLIGCELVRKLADQPIWSLRVLDLQSKPSDLNCNLEWIQGNILDHKTRRKALADIDGVLHLAAVSRVIDAENDPVQCMKSNVVGTQMLLQDAANSQVPPWIVYGSSREVYGEPTSLPVAETSDLVPVNVYGVSKIACEHLIKLYSTRTGQGTATIRYSNVYGNMNDQLSRVVPKFIMQALKGETLSVHGEDTLFDFTHVEDAVEATIRLLGKLRIDPKLVIEPIHVVTGQGTSLHELAKLVVKTTGSHSLIKIDAARDYDVQRFVGNPSRMNEVLGMTTRVTLAEGLRRFAETMKRAQTHESNPMETDEST